MGLEPMTSSLPRKCSTTELQQHFRIHPIQGQQTYLGKRVKGIEPSYSAWKAAALPLSYTRITKGKQLSSDQLLFLQRRSRVANPNFIRFQQSVYKSPSTPVSNTVETEVGGVGFEPT